MEYNKYYWLNEDSRTFLSRGYISESPEQRIKDIAIKAEKYLNIKGFAEKFEDYMARGFYSLSTPVWINFGKQKGLPISCYGSNVDDNLDSILNAGREIGMMSKYGGGTSAFIGNIRARGTEISTLPGGENLGQIDDIIYFQKKLYRSLNVPINRLEQESTFALGRSTEISRDEVKFKKFIDRLRKRFSDVFMQTLKTQLLLKGIITVNDWDEWKELIAFDFIEDNYFSELKEAEIVRERFELIASVDEYVGKYISNEWVRKNILRQTDDDIIAIDKQIEGEDDGEDDDDLDL